MRPEAPPQLLDRVSRVLGAAEDGGSLAERLGREVWIDFVADTGDDHDLSVAVAGMVFFEYALGGEAPRRLPRGDVLICDGDTAYRSRAGWISSVDYSGPGTRSLASARLTAGLACCSGLDGFGRLFRRSPLEDLPAPVALALTPEHATSLAERVLPPHCRARSPG